jgi:NTP pyrophosphatase (non-canonical NTP hydrolase)
MVHGIEVIKRMNDFQAGEKPTSHSELVRSLKKAPDEIIHSLSPLKADVIHMVLGVAGEAGELVDAIKKWSIYQKPLDFQNVIEELGDLEFYMEGLRQSLLISREAILRANIDKLNKRYSQGYSDKAAIERADKVSE